VRVLKARNEIYVFVSLSQQRKWIIAGPGQNTGKIHPQLSLDSRSSWTICCTCCTPSFWTSL